MLAARRTGRARRRSRLAPIARKDARAPKSVIDLKVYANHPISVQ